MKRLAAALLIAPLFAANPTSQAVRNRPPLQPNAFYPLPLGSVKPKGWLRQQLQIQANGLSGHLDEFWPDLQNSGWLGKGGDSWERGPYYMDGLVPLAYLLDDPELILKANKWVSWTLDHPLPNGDIGPAKKIASNASPSEADKPEDWWPNMVTLKALTQFQEATGDPRVIPLMQAYFKYQASQLASDPLRSWAQYRWEDEVVSILWLYNRTGDAQLLDLAKTLHSQGYDWKAQFANFQFRDKSTKDQIIMKTHVVNNAMALKTSAVWWLISRDKSDHDAVYKQLGEMDKYHLLANGVHSGDEHYAGHDPTQGTELCAVVEGMFSLEEMMAILGDPALGDREEKIAFNALPGAFTGDMWAHQYDQQPNQVEATIAPRHWTSNKPDSNIFGLEPNYGCCTANYHQGFPKFAANLWMATPGNGLAAVFYGPSEVRTTLSDGTGVRIQEETEYPFKDKIRMTVRPDRPASFALVLRIPAWTEKALVNINGKAQTAPKPGTFYTLYRTWSPGDQVNIEFPMPVRVSRWYHNSASLERGPLVFSLKMGEDWSKIKDEGLTADWQAVPTTAWNYGLLLSTSHPDKSVQVIEHPVGDVPFTPAGAPVELRVKARKLPHWKMEENSAGPLPGSPNFSMEPVETITLIPYGSAKLRITEFPVLLR